MVGEDTVALKETGACVVFGDWVCVVAVVLIVAGIVGTTFCGEVIVSDEGEIVFGGGVLIFGVTISSGGGLVLPGGGEVIISDCGICIIDGSASIICGGGVAIFEGDVVVLQAIAVVLELFELSSDFFSAVFVFLFPGCDVAQGGVTFGKPLLTSLCD